MRQDRAAVTLRSGHEPAPQLGEPVVDLRDAGVGRAQRGCRVQVVAGQVDHFAAQPAQAVLGIGELLVQDGQHPVAVALAGRDRGVGRRRTERPVADGSGQGVGVAGHPHRKQCGVAAGGQVRQAHAERLPGLEVGPALPQERLLREQFVVVGELRAEPAAQLGHVDAFDQVRDLVARPRWRGAEELLQQPLLDGCEALEELQQEVDVGLTTCRARLRHGRLRFMPGELFIEPVVDVVDVQQPGALESGQSAVQVVLRQDDLHLGEVCDGHARTTAVFASG